MKKSILLSIVFCLMAVQWSAAQVPKWLDKSKRAVFSVITYDKGGDILNNGNGFFVTEDGVALSDYSLFKNAARAVAVDADGKQMEVDAILGASSLYEVVKFRVNTGKGKVTALPITQAGPAAGDDVYLMPYSTQKEKLFTAGKVKEATTMRDDFRYYTLDMKMSDKMVSCPLMTADGKVFAIAQPASGQQAETQCYGVDVNFGMSLNITALSFSDYNLNLIGIRKGLPDTEEQSLVFLYMASSTLGNEEYAALLDDFIRRFPNSVDGHIRRAEHYAYRGDGPSATSKADGDLAKALIFSVKKDDVHYNKAKIIYNYLLRRTDNQQAADWTFALAAEEVNKSISIDPLPVYTQLRGDIYFAMQDYQQAYNSYEEVTHSNLVSPAVFFSAAKAKQLMNADVNEVLALMDSCIARCPEPMTAENALYLLERAQLNMEAEQYRPAMLDYDKYYDAVSGNVNDVFYFYREQASFYARQFQRALDDIAAAIRLNPGEPTYHLEAGRINLRVGRNEEAEQNLTKAIELAAEYAEAYRLRGIARIQMERKTEACDDLRKAKELGDETVDALIEKHCN